MQYIRNTNNNNTLEHMGMHGMSSLKKKNYMLVSVIINVLLVMTQ